MIQRLPKLLVFLLGAIFVINLVQSYFTELIFDEAYYWYYAQNMDWGYFDHPPMVALLIKISSFFFDGELGIRFMSCVLSVATFLVLWQLIDYEKKKHYVLHFFVLVFSMTLLNAYGFLTLPDTPLLFFTALFLLIYKKFIQQPSFLIALLLGVVMAALMYSKYHAVLVIFFVLLSNIKLVTNKYAWFSVIIALLCYTPHFLWLYNNDFVSIKYHLFERSNAAYNFNKYTLALFINLAAIFGLTFPWIYKALLKTKASDLFTKALLYLTYGVIIFFFISSFNRRVQAQWVIVISIPLAIIAFNYILHNESTRKWIYKMGIANIVILFFLRVGLIYEPIFPVYYESHGNKDWVNKVDSLAGDKTVVFENSYRFAPMYSFYTGKTSFSLNNFHYRQNQYTIDSSEYAVQHKKVLYISQWISEREISFTTLNDETFYGRIIEDFESYRKLKCFVTETSMENPWDTTFELKVFNPYNTDIPLEKLKFSIAYLNKYKELRDTQSITHIQTSENILTLKSNDTVNFTFKLPKTKMKDPGYFKIGISENKLPFGLNGASIKLH